MNGESFEMSVTVFTSDCWARTLWTRRFWIQTRFLYLFWLKVPLKSLKIFLQGNVSGSDSSDDDVTKGGSVTPSYNHYQYGGYNHYVSSGAVQQSWQNSYGRARSRNMYSYTDSEAESSMPSTSHYRQGLGLNQPSSSRQHLVLSSPDGPGSRAPLPNFSSFV